MQVSVYKKTGVRYNTHCNHGRRNERKEMDEKFCAILADLRKKRGVSQRRAATDLRISQALLSHYENGAREPGLQFVCRACDYYGVSADYLLGRSDETGSKSIQATELRALAEQLRRLAETAENCAQ